MNIFRYFAFAISIILLSSTNVLFGIQSIKTFSFLLIVLVYLIDILKNNRKKIIAEIEARNLFYLSVFIFIFRLFVQENPFDIFNILFFPVVTYLVVNKSNEKTIKIIRKTILLFFLLNCTVSIIEYIIKFNFFPLITDDKISDIEMLEGFRSTALLGHPLNNSLCHSIIMGSIYCSSIKISHKIVLLILGFISFMTFNSRGVILLWSFLFLIILLNIMLTRSRNLRYKLKAFFIFIVFLLISTYCIFYLKFGDRLINFEILDASSQTRINILDSFSGLDNMEFLSGSSKKYNLLLTQRKNGGFENSFVVLIYKYGIVISLFIVYYLYAWWAKIVSKLNYIEKSICFMSLILAGNLNNGLFNLYPLYIYSICSILIFSNNRYTTPKKDIGYAF